MLKLIAREYFLEEEIAEFNGITTIEAREIVKNGQVNVNFCRALNPSRFVSLGDLIEVINDTDQIYQTWRVGE